MSTTLLPNLKGLVADDRRSLQGSRCLDCANVRFPAADVCPACQARHVEAVPLGATGRVYTYSIVHAPPPGYLGEVPYAVGIVELPGGLRVTTTLLADDLDAIAVGQRAEFELMEIGADDDRYTSFAYRVDT